MIKRPSAQKSQPGRRRIRNCGPATTGGCGAKRPSAPQTWMMPPDPAFTAAAQAYESFLPAARGHLQHRADVTNTHRLSIPTSAISLYYRVVR
ncbi:hypothetical protein F4W66_11635 [Escherichia coli]|nr:hypothetical protein F4W66_11635 [Escherichia coli]